MSYTKYLFIPLERPIPADQEVVLINQLFEALASPVSTVKTVTVGFTDRYRAIRVAYRMDGDDPDDESDLDYQDGRM